MHNSKSLSNEAEIYFLRSFYISKPRTLIEGKMHDDRLLSIVNKIFEKLVNGRFKITSRNMAFF